MNKEKEVLYKKACVELNEILSRLPKEQISKIPDNFRENLIKNMNTNYVFNFDNSKGIFDQNIMIETEALLVGVYEKYFATVEEKPLWDKYNKICLNEIENKKREKFDSNGIFENRKIKNEVVNSEEIIVYKEHFGDKIKNIFKDLKNKWISFFLNKNN